MSELIFELPTITPSTTESAPDGAINHADAAVDRLAQQFRNKPKIEAFIRALCTPMARLEQAHAEVIISRLIEHASGESLRQLARFVGQPVLTDLSEEDLRRYVRARIIANRSNGTGEDILAIARLIINDETTRIRAHTVGGAVASVQLENNPTDFDISTILYRDFLSQAVGIAIRLELEWWTGDEEDMFEFESFSGPTGSGEGWGSTLDANLGGIMASVIS